MKKLRLLLIVLAALLVAQVSKAQVVHDQWVIPLVNDWIYCLDENVTGDLVYDVKYKYDTDGNLVHFSYHNKGTFLVGQTTGSTYKLLDMGHEKYGVGSNEGELMINGLYKIISLSDGITYDGRVQIHIDLDKDGTFVIKKEIWDLCF